MLMGNSIVAHLQVRRQYVSVSDQSNSLGRIPAESFQTD